jgi:DNA-binding response OmpR family regulator
MGDDETLAGTHEPTRVPPLLDGERRHQPVILVVDNDPAVCDVIAAALAEAEFRVECVYSGDDALQRLKGERVDLAVVDMFLGDGIDGIDLAPRVLGAGGAVIMTSGALAADERLAGTGYELLRKPFRLEALVAMVRARTRAAEELAR